MDYIEIDVSIEPLVPFSDILVAELADLGFESFVNSEKGLQAYIQHHLFDSEKVNSLLLQYNNDDCKISFQQKNIPAQNWNAQWESSFEPIEVDGECIVRAPFHSKPDNIKYDIVIEPKMSFGTGHHETTYLMLQQLLHLPLKNKSLLDMGCGTSVLAILAAQLGANPILAIDTDEWAYENSKENCALNECSQIVVKLGNSALLQGMRFNIILANINRNVLMNDMIHYYNSLEQDGELLISGFFDVDTKMLIEHAKKLGLKMKHQQSKNNWAIIHFQK